MHVQNSVRNDIIKDIFKTKNDVHWISDVTIIHILLTDKILKLTQTSEKLKVNDAIIIFELTRAA